MRVIRTAMIGVMLMGLATVAFAEEPLRTITWSQAQQGAERQDVEVIPADGETPFARLCVVKEGPDEEVIPLFALENPGITKANYALIGKVRTKDVEGEGYLEMWNHFPDGGAYFSRTLASYGPMKCLKGTQGWRYFVLPFHIVDDNGLRPTELTFDVFLPGKGTVEIGPLTLVQSDKSNEVLRVPGQWWGDGTGGLIGGIAGIVFGCLGGAIGAYSSKGKRRGFVMGALKVMVVAGVASLVAGIIAMTEAQPYGVWFPLVLLGVLLTLIPLQMRPQIRKRYEAFELRRMESLDADA